MVAIEGLEDLSQSFMRVILFVPHILVVLDLALLVQSESDKRVDSLGRLDNLGRVGLLQLEDDVIGLVLNDLRLKSLRFGEDLGNAYMKVRTNCVLELL